MSKSVNAVSNSSTFQEWVESTNNLVDLASVTVTVAANSTGDITSGNGYVNGVFGANSIVVGSSLGGGTVGSPNTLVVVTNTEFTSSITILANTNIVANNIVFAGNSTTNNITVTANTTTSIVNFGGTYVIVSSNLIANGTLTIPAGNTANRPSNLQNGLIRYNTDTLAVEYVANNAWLTLQTSPTNANTVVYTSTDKVPENNVQDAIDYLSTSVVQIQGNNTISGGIVVINVPGSTLPTDIGTTSVIHTIQAEGSISRILADATRNNNAFTGKRSNGTSDSRTALANNDQIVTYDGFGYNGSVYSNTATASIAYYAGEAWSTSNNGSYITVNVTPNGTNTSITALYISSSNLIINTASVIIKGSATFNANVSANNLAVANNLTVNGYAVWTSGNMGNGSGLNADLLDGLDSSYFQANLGYTPLNSNTYTASDILTKIKTVDGSGSGLDADLLDGNDSSYFQANLGFTPVQQGGGTGQGNNKIYIGYGASQLNVQVDTTNYGTVWPISISGNAATIAGYGLSSSAQYIANTNGIVTTSGVWGAIGFNTISFASSITLNLASIINGSLTMTGNATLATPSNLKIGQTGTILIQQDSTGGRTLAYSSAWKFPFAITPSLSTGANEIDLLFYMVLPGNLIYGNLVKGLT